MTDHAAMSPDELWAQIPSSQRAILDANRFDAEQFLALRRAYLSGELSAQRNRLQAEVTPPEPQDIRELPARESAAGREFIQLGEAAIARGEVGAVVLNGGMATRFGGIVKGCVEIFDGLSFLALKALDARRHGPKTRLLLMNSFATAQKTAQHLMSHDNFGLGDEQIIPFTQSISIRLTPAGGLFWEEGGEAREERLSFYAPGHGDLQTALGRGALDKFRQKGGKYLLMSNVDNTLATLDPLVVGMHVAASADGVEMSVEAVQKKPGQVGGFVARAGQKPQIVEHFRLPDPAIKDELELLNTNTFLFDAAALSRPAELTWFVVEKSVNGRPAIQFERLAGELSAILSTRILKVPATGDASRFEPVKTPQNLEDNRARLKTLSQRQGLIDG